MYAAVAIVVVVEHFRADIVTRPPFPQVCVVLLLKVVLSFVASTWQYLTANQPFNSSMKDSSRSLLLQGEYVFNSCYISKLYKCKQENENYVYVMLIYLSCVWIARHIGFDIYVHYLTI